MPKPEFLRRKDWQVKAVVGICVYGLFFAFCIFQFVRFDNAKKNPRYTTDVHQLDMKDLSMFDESDLRDITFPPFLVCPTWFHGARSNLTDFKCTVSSKGQSVPVSSSTAVGTFFTPRFGTATWNNCKSVVLEAQVQSIDYFMDFVDCHLETDGNAMLYIFSETFDLAHVPTDNNQWILLRQGNDVNIGLKRTRVIGVFGEVEESGWEHVIQEQQDLEIPAGSGLYFTIQYSFLGTVNQQGFFPYDFWIMSGIIGGTFIIFNALFVAIVFCFFQFLNIKDRDSEYENINEK